MLKNNTPALDLIFSNPLAALLFAAMLSKLTGKLISAEQLQLLIALDPLMAQLLELMAELMMQVARNGAKLLYVKKLRGECPDGYLMEYFAAGGLMCSKCMKKASQGTKVESEPSYINKFRENLKAKKIKCGAKVPMDKCGGKPKKKC